MVRVRFDIRSLMVGICWLMIIALPVCQTERRTHILPPDIHLQAGDIVFRQGVGATSRMVRAADSNGVYSHVGLVVDSGDSLMIIHAVPDEPEFEGDYDRVKRNTPEQFYATMRAAAGEVLRLREPDGQAVHRAVQYAQAAYEAGIAFDHDYNDTDTTQLYCCELIERAFLLSGISVSDHHRHALFCPGLGDLYCILPSDILHSSQLESIYKFN